MRAFGTVYIARSVPQPFGKLRASLQVAGDYPTQAFNSLSASIVMGFMILPLVASLSEDAMSAVPGSLLQAAYALGATRLEVAFWTFAKIATWETIPIQKQRRISFGKAPGSVKMWGVVANRPC